MTLGEKHRNSKSFEEKGAVGGDGGGDFEPKHYFLPYSHLEMDNHLSNTLFHSGRAKLVLHHVCVSAECCYEP